MTPHVSSPQGGTAWQDAPTRKTIALYGLRALGLLVLAIALVFVGSLTLNDNGDAKAGVPGFVPFIILMPGILSALLGAAGLFNVFRILFVVARRPWVPMPSDFHLIDVGGINGQPILFLGHDSQQVTLTVAAPMWRWQRFDLPEVMLAARLGRGGVVATPDRRSIVWAGRSAMTAYYLWRERHGSISARIWRRIQPKTPRTNNTQVADAPLSDLELENFDNGVAVLRRDGQVKGHVATSLGSFWSPSLSRRTQPWVWFIVIWSDGTREHPEEDYPPWTFVREIQCGYFEGPDSIRYDAEWLPEPERSQMWEEFGLKPDDF